MSILLCECAVLSNQYQFDNQMALFSCPHSAVLAWLTAASPLCLPQQQAAWAVCICWRWRMWRQKMWVCAWWRLNPDHLIQQKEHRHTTLLIWMCKTRQSGNATKQIRYGFKALQVMCCLLTFILCYYCSLSVGENDNALGFKALRRAQHLRVLTFLVLIGWICVLRVTTEIGTTTLETKTSLTGKSLKRLLPGMHITPGNWFWPPSF